MTRAWVSWSSGKDSTYALHEVRRDPSVNVTGLLVTMNRAADRVAMHAVRRSLIEAQADRLRLPLHVVEIPSPCPNDVYERRMDEAMGTAVRGGVGSVVFGDLFLDDVRAYRERALADCDVRPLFPLWGRATKELAHEMIASGVRAVLTCVDPTKLPASFAGRHFDEELLADLPPDVDPCGERGEFHTFVWDAPGFASPIDVRTGAVIARDGFVFCDVVPTESAGRTEPDCSDAARAAHDTAVAAGDAFYPDPDTGYLVFTGAALALRGHCCGRGCRHCPYPADEQHRAGRPGAR
jgi:uncharacterized protein (TIGR00290 family)